MKKSFFISVSIAITCLSATIAIISCNKKADYEEELSERISVRSYGEKKALVNTETEKRGGEFQRVHSRNMSRLKTCLPLYVTSIQHLRTCTCARAVGTQPNFVFRHMVMSGLLMESPNAIGNEVRMQADRYARTKKQYNEDANVHLGGRLYRDYRCTWLQPIVF